MCAGERDGRGQSAQQHECIAGDTGRENEQKRYAVGATEGALRHVLCLSCSATMPKNQSRTVICLSAAARVVSGCFARWPSAFRPTLAAAQPLAWCQGAAAARLVHPLYRDSCALWCALPPGACVKCKAGYGRVGARCLPVRAGKVLDCMCCGSSRITPMKVHLCRR